MSKDTVIFLDVDGVLNHLYVWSIKRVEQYGFDRHEFIHKDEDRGGAPYRVAVHFPTWMPQVVQHLVENYDVRWLTTWRDYANTQLGPILGIPELPVVTDGTRERHVGWKPKAAAPVAERLLREGKRVIWIEDFYGRIPVAEMPRGVEFVDTGSREGLFGSDIPDLLTPELLDLARPGLLAGQECGECWGSHGKHKFSCSQQRGYVESCFECLAPNPYHETWCRDNPDRI